MGIFYSHKIDNQKKMYLYSERGLLSYLFSHIMPKPKELKSVLKEAKNSKEESLDQIVVEQKGVKSAYGLTGQA